MYDTIPASLYNIRTMTSLKLQNNNFTGKVETFSSDLTEIDLGNNNFHGAVQMISELVSVNYLNLSRNNFSG